MEKTTLQLETLTCPSCIRKIEGTVGKQKGVESATVRFNASKVDVLHDQALIDKNQIKQLITNLGYKVLGE